MLRLCVKQCRCPLYKPADLDLHCIQKRIYLSSAGKGLIAQQIQRVDEKQWILPGKLADLDLEETI